MMTTLFRLLTALILAGIAVCATAPAFAQSFPGNPNTGQIWVGQGANSAPNWVTPAGDCTIGSSGAIFCPTLAGVTPGTLFPLGAGTGLSISGGKLNISNSITPGGPTGSATVTPIITYNAQGMLTAVSSATIAPPFSAITGQATFGQLPTLNADSVMGNFTGGSTTPGQAALSSCSGASNALIYNTGTHAFGCNSISGSGSAGYGITIVANVVSAPLISYVARPMFGGL